MECTPYGLWPRGGDAGRDFPLHCLGLVYFLLSDRCAWARHQASEDAVILIILANIMQPNQTNARSTPYSRTLFAILAVSKQVDRGARKPDWKRRQRSNQEIRNRRKYKCGQIQINWLGKPEIPGQLSNWISLEVECIFGRCQARRHLRKTSERKRQARYCQIETTLEWIGSHFAAQSVRSVGLSAATSDYRVWSVARPTTSLGIAIG